MGVSDSLQWTTEQGRKIQKNDPNISKDIQDIQDIQSKYKIPSGSRPGPSQGPREPIFFPFLFLIQSQSDDPLYLIGFNLYLIGFIYI